MVLVALAGVLIKFQIAAGDPDALVKWSIQANCPGYCRDDGCEAASARDAGCKRGIHTPMTRSASCWKASACLFDMDCQANPSRTSSTASARRMPVTSFLTMKSAPHSRRSLRSRSSCLEPTGSRETALRSQPQKSSARRQRLRQAPLTARRKRPAVKRRPTQAPHRLQHMRLHCVDLDIQKTSHFFLRETEYLA